MTDTNKNPLPNILAYACEQHSGQVLGDCGRPFPGGPGSTITDASTGTFSVWVADGRSYVIEISDPTAAYASGFYDKGSTNPLGYTATLPGATPVAVSGADVNGITVALPSVGVTPVGTNVVVTPVSTGGTGPVAPVDLTGTVTVGGTTSLATSVTAPTLPSGYQLPLSSPIYYDLSTTATYSGNIAVCISYAGITPAPTQLLHYDATLGWQDITTSIDTASQTICGTTASFSPFALVTRTPLTITADSKAKAYGAALPTLSVTYSYAGVVTANKPNGAGGTLTVSTTATAASPVGTYPITPSGLSSAGYAITFVPGTLTVTKSPLTVTAPSPSRAYGAANPSLTPAYNGFVNGDKAASLTTQPTCSTTATTASPVGTYPVTCTGGASSNYAIAYVAGTLTIAIADRYVTPVNTTLTVAAPGILALTSGSVSAITITKAPQGSLTVKASGAFTYVPKSGFSGTDTFAYRATVNGTLAPAVTVTIYVLGKGMNCASCNLSGLSANGLALTGSNLSGANLTGTSLVGANLSGANLSGVVATGVSLTSAILTGANLSAAAMSGATLVGANLTGANASKANLSSATLNSATLIGANLSAATMPGATLVSANLTGANVSQANLASANLTSANFSGANLAYANLKGATIAGANFTGANVSGVIWH